MTKANGGDPVTDLDDVDIEEVCCINCRLIFRQDIRPYPRPCPRCGMIAPA